MAVARAARGFKSDSSKRPRELNLRCIDSFDAMHRPREAAPSRNWGDDDAAPGSAGRVPTGSSGRTARGPHFISNGGPCGDVRQRARSRSKSNDARRRRPFGRLVARAARCAGFRMAARGAQRRAGASACVRSAASHACRAAHRVPSEGRATPFPDADTVARMRRMPHAATGFRPRIASGPAPGDARRPDPPATLAERARAA